MLEEDKQILREALFDLFYNIRFIAAYGPIATCLDEAVEFGTIAGYDFTNEQEVKIKTHRGTEISIYPSYEGLAVPNITEEVRMVKLREHSNILIDEIIQHYSREHKNRLLLLHKFVSCAACPVFPCPREGKQRDCRQCWFEYLREEK